MATRTKTTATATEGAETAGLIAAIDVFLERIQSITFRSLTDTVSAYDDIARELRPIYDAKNANHRAAQTSTAEDKKTDWPITKFHAHLETSLGEGFKMKEPALRAVVDFWNLHSAEAFAGYNDKCATDQRIGSWTNYVDYLRDVKRGYIGTDGKETGKRPARGQATSTDAGIQLTMTQFVEEIEAPNMVERMIIARKRLHDMTWQVAEGMLKLSPEQRRLVESAIKAAKSAA